MTLPVAFNSMGMPAVPEQFKNLFGEVFSGLSGGLRILKAGKASFTVNEGGSKVEIPNGDLYGVLLGTSPYNHCVWYAKSYTVGQEPTKPDLVWVQRDPDKFPDALPKQFRQKVTTDGGRSRWAFQIARRTVWALFRRETDGTWTLDIDNPVLFDITSTNLYGKTDPASNCYKWTGMRGFCSQYSQGGYTCTPQMFATQIIVDLKAPNIGTILFKPFMVNGQPAWLDTPTFNRILEKGQSDQVKDLLEINEILDWNQAQPVTPRPVQPPLATAQPVPPTPPTPPTPPASGPAQTANVQSLLAEAQDLINKQKANAPQVTAQAALDSIMATLGMK